MSNRVLCALAAAVLLIACGPPSPRTSEPTPAVQSDVAAVEAWQIEVWRDPVNGCEYVIFDGGYNGGITPRLNADGSQRCGPPDAQRTED